MQMLKHSYCRAPKNGLKYYAGTKPTEGQLQIKRHIGLRGLCLVFGYLLMSL